MKKVDGTDTHTHTDIVTYGQNWPMCGFSENSAQLYQSYGILMLKACKGVDFFSIGRVCYQWKLEDTARYAGFLLALVEDFMLV